MDDVAHYEWVKMQKILDVIGNEEGSILMRGPHRWVALKPGNKGDVLVIGDSMLPEWRAPEDVPGLID